MRCRIFRETSRPSLGARISRPLAPAAPRQRVAGATPSGNEDQHICRNKTNSTFKRQPSAQPKRPGRRGRPGFNEINLIFRRNYPNIHVNRRHHPEKFTGFCLTSPAINVKKRTIVSPKICFCGESLWSKPRLRTRNLLKKSSSRSAAAP